MIKGPLEEQKLEIDHVRDRALIYIDSEFKGIMERTRQMDEINIKLGFGDEIKIDILVENMGRVNYGPKLCDEKGIVGGIKLGQQYHFGWTMYPLPLENLSELSYTTAGKVNMPTFLRGSFNVSEKDDTFLRLDGFTKGVAFINGFNLGRYWNTAGPQKTLYIPAPLLKDGANELIVFEIESCMRNAVTLVDKPDLG